MNSALSREVEIDPNHAALLFIDVQHYAARPDGGTYHITWSLAGDRKAKESNDVIRDEGWQRFDQPVEVKLEPASFR